MAYRVAVVGATGAVGREMLKTLAERHFSVAEIAAVASARSTGQELSFGEKKVLKVRNLETFDFAGWDIGLFSPGAAVSAVHAPRAAKAGCLVIDNSSHFRMEPDVPLVVPEVNPQALRRIRRGIVANPNCSTIQMVLALKPLHDKFRVKRVVVATYQSVSGAGKEGMDELWTQSRAIHVNDAVTPQEFTKPIAFNVIPHIDKFMDDGSTKEEWKMVVETKKILDPDIKVAATCVRVPVFIGHSEAINVEFEQPVTVAEARAVLREAPGHCGAGPARGRRLHHAARLRRRGRDLCQPHPQGPDRRTRAAVLVRVGQFAQRGGAERRADRRDGGAAEAVAVEGGLASRVDPRIKSGGDVFLAIVMAGLDPAISRQPTARSSPNSSARSSAPRRPWSRPACRP